MGPENPHWRSHGPLQTTNPTNNQLACCYQECAYIQFQIKVCSALRVTCIRSRQTKCSQSISRKQTALNRDQTHRVIILAIPNPNQPLTLNSSPGELCLWPIHMQKNWGRWSGGSKNRAKQTDGHDRSQMGRTSSKPKLQICSMHFVLLRYVFETLVTSDNRGLRLTVSLCAHLGGSYSSSAVTRNSRQTNGHLHL